jgi:hypothetical protein
MTELRVPASTVEPKWQVKTDDGWSEVWMTIETEAPDGSGRVWLTFSEGPTKVVDRTELLEARPPPDDKVESEGEEDGSRHTQHD